MQFGAEKLAIEHNYAVVFGVIHKLQRVNFQGEFKLVCENAQEIKNGQITETTTKRLENKLLKKPINHKYQTDESSCSPANQTERIHLHSLEK